MKISLLFTALILAWGIQAQAGCGPGGECWGCPVGATWCSPSGEPGSFGGGDDPVLLKEAIPAKFLGALCPPDSCNYANGCMDGCSAEQLTCSAESVGQCAGQKMGTVCHWQVEGESGYGYCTATAPLPEGTGSSACGCG